MIKYSKVSLTCPISGKILEDIDFEIREGEFFVIIGPSGSGKTTTLKLINRLIEQTEGDILFQGKKLKDYNLRELRLETGYVLQQIALFPNLTVEENIALIPEMKGMDKKLIALKIPIRCFSPPDNLSGSLFIYCFGSNPTFFSSSSVF